MSAGRVPSRELKRWECIVQCCCKWCWTWSLTERRMQRRCCDTRRCYRQGSCIWRRSLDTGGLHNNNNNNNANICVVRLKQNSSGALMAQTNTVSVFVQMTTVTVSGVADRPEDCSKLLLQWLWSSFCRVLFLSQWQRGSRTQQIEDVIGLPQYISNANSRWSLCRAH